MQEARAVTSSGDLRAELGEQILLKLALDGVQSLERCKLGTAVIGTTGLRPEMMLTLLSYCYASRLYGSQEIERAVCTNRTIRYICARTFPDWRAIRYFRRHNRELIEQCLAYVLRKAWILQAEPFDTDWLMCKGPAGTFDEVFAAQAREKIDVAIIMDRTDGD
jgi:hypothetical protein